MAKATATEVAEKDYTAYVAKNPTDLQERFTDWLLEKTEYDPAQTKSKMEVFKMAVKLSVALRIPFQASPENQAALEEARAASAQRAEEPKPARKSTKAAAEDAPAKVAARTGRKATKAAAAPAEDEEEAPAAPVTRTRQPAKRAGRGRAAAASQDAEEEAPF